MARTTLYDHNFTGSNGAAVDGLSPSTGAPLVETSGGWLVQDNRAYGRNNFTSIHLMSTTDQGSVSNGMITMTTKYVAAPSSGSATCAAFMRRQDGANFIRVEATTTQLEIYEFTGGGSISRSVCTYAITWAVGDTHTFGMELNGTAAKLFYDGAEVASGTVSWTTADQVAGQLGSSANDFTSTNGFHHDRMLLQSLDVASTRRRPALLTTRRERKATVSRIVTRTWAGPPGVVSTLPADYYSPRKPTVTIAPSIRCTVTVRPSLSVTPTITP